MRANDDTAVTAIIMDSDTSKTRNCVTVRAHEPFPPPFKALSLTRVSRNQPKRPLSEFKPAIKYSDKEHSRAIKKTHGMELSVLARTKALTR
jgi:hypothetical protein